MIQPGFTYGASAGLTKTKERMQSLKKRYIYQNELEQVFFQHDVAYRDFKEWTRKTAPGKILRYKGFNIAGNLKHDGNQRALASMVYKSFDKKSFCHAWK